MPSRDRLAGSWQLLSSIGHRKYDFLAVVPFTRIVGGSAAPSARLRRQGRGM